MILVGTFNEKQLRNGEDKVAVEKAKKETGLGYTNTQVIKKNGKPIGLRIWVCNREEVKLI